MSTERPQPEARKTRNTLNPRLVDPNPRSLHVHVRRGFGGFRAFRAWGAAIAALTLLLGSARAEWKTETFSLAPGWNAIYLHVDPSHDSVDNLLAGSPISQVELWAPSLSSAQFITSIQTTTAFGSSWISWDSDPNDGVPSVLQNFIGNAAYLVYVSGSNPFQLSLKGKVVPPAYRWTSSGQNFIGFSTKAGSEPSFVNFFQLSPTLDTFSTEVYEYPGGELGPTNPRLVDTPNTTQVKRGRAYWVRDDEYNRYFAPFSLKLQESGGVHFGTSLSGYRIRLENVANVAQTVTMQMVSPEMPPAGQPAWTGVPPILVRGELDPQTFTYDFAELASGGSVVKTLAAAGQAGSSVEIVLGIDRAAITGNAGDHYSAILRFTDLAGFSEIDVPVTAEAGSLAGLWVGEAEITRVQQDLREFAVDADGNTTLNPDGSSQLSSTDVSYGGVARSYALRLIMHMDNNSNTRLLQRIYYGLNEAESPILATREGLLNANHLDVARRITSVHLPWSENNTGWSLLGELGFGNTVQGTVATAFSDHAANPFLHTYHPDHDNKDAEFSSIPLAEGVESYGIERTIRLNAGATLSPAPVGSASAPVSTTADPAAPAAADLPSAIAMVPLAGGTFIMGDDSAQGPLANAHKPARSVSVNAFEMSEAEITVQQYVDFLNAALADGLITVTTDAGGTFVYGAAGQPYAGHKFIELSGSRVLKDHDGDGDIDPENPLNQCWVAYNGTSFSVKDPAAVDFVNFDYVANTYSGPAEVGPSAWSSGAVLAGIVPTVAAHNGLDGNGVNFKMDGARHVVVESGVAYVASSTGDTLQVLNVTDPNNPLVIRTIAGLDNVLHLRLEGNHLFASVYTDNAVVIYNVNELNDPNATVTEVARLNDGDESTRMATTRCTAVAGNYLYVVSDDDYLVIFDISTPSAPVLKKEMQLVDGSTTFLDLKWIDIVGGVAYVVSSTQNGVVLLDLTDPENPTLLSSIKDGTGFPNLGGALNVVVDGDILYVAAAADDAVSVINIADRSNPVLLAEMKNGVAGFELDSARVMDLNNDLLFIPGNGVSDSVNVVDVRNPAAPVLLEVIKHGTGNYTKLDGAIDVEVHDGVIYICGNSSDALTIIPLPVSGGSIPATTIGITPPEWNSTPLLGNTTPQVISIGDSDSAGTAYNTAISLTDVVTTDGVAFVAVPESDKVMILNVSDPSDPLVLANLVHDGGNNQLDRVVELTLAGNILITVNDAPGATDYVTLYDVTDPAAPVRKARLQGPFHGMAISHPIDAVVSGNKMYVSSITDWISVFDITDPANPALLHEFQTGTTDANGQTFKLDNAEIAVEGDLLFVAATGIQIIDVANPENPLVLAEIQDGVGGFNSVADAGQMLVENGILYFTSAGGENAVTIANVSDPANPVMLAEFRDGDGTYSTLAGLRQPQLAENVLYLPALDDNAVTMVDVSTPANPVRLEELVGSTGNYSGLTGPKAVAVSGGTVFVTADNGAIALITPAGLTGESIAHWPELTTDLPTQSEVATWPATFIKWHGGKAFAEFYGCDLPTEAQWEFAARGGAAFNFGTADGSIDAAKANYNEYNLHPDQGHVEAVKSFAPNPFGFYDLSGNVWEWCRDWYNPNFYSTSPNPDTDPFNDALYLGSSEPLESPSFTGGPGQPYNGDARVKRGGSWNFHESALGSAARERDYTWRGNDHFGFRIVRDGFRVTPASSVSFTARTSTSTQLSGVYQETITLRGKNNATKTYNIAGEFTLNRISDISTLKTE